jgi:Fe-S cluster assembly protein SufB
MTEVKNQEAFEAAERASTYEWGFSSDIEQEFAPKGLSEDTSATSRPRRTSPNGCSNGGSRPIAPG